MRAADRTRRAGGQLVMDTMNRIPPVVEFFYRGRTERWSVLNRRYMWHDGYSEDGPNGGETQPWLTMEEARTAARHRGCRAAFFRRDDHTESGR